MTTSELAEFGRLKAAIIALEERKDALIVSATSATHELKEDAGGGKGITSDIVGIKGSAIADIERMIAQKKWEMEVRLESIVQYLSQVNDDIIFTAMTLHYIDGLTWNSTAQKIGGNTADSLRMEVKRYVKAHP